MDLNTFLTLAFIGVIVLCAWGADKSIRKRTLEHRQWNDRLGIEPMSEEDERINRILAERRAKK